MRSLDEILEQVRRLPAGERRELLERLDETFSDDEPNADAPALASSYAPLLEIAGTVHSDFADVSTDKYAHLGAAYAGDRGEG